MNTSLYRHALEHAVGSPRQMASRKVALERFFTYGLPSPRDEDWKYTALDFLERAEWHAPQHAAEDWACEDYPGTVLKFGNGRMTDVFAKSIHAHSLAERVDTPLVVRHLGQLADTLPGGGAGRHQQCAVAARSVAAPPDFPTADKETSVRK